MTDSTQLQIIPEPIGGPGLVADYLQGAGPASSFFHGSPTSVAGFEAKLREVTGRFDRAARERAARALTPTSARAGDRLARFVEQGGAMVTTGQQAGLFAGPLYTVYKALTAVRLAAVLEARLGTTVIPVFWTASEDHDWAEANHTYLSVAGAGTRRVELQSDDPRPLPMSDRPLGDEARLVLDELSHVVGSVGYSSEVLKWARDAYQPGESVSGAFRSLITRVLAPFDVCVTDAADPVLKGASTAVLEEAIRNASRHEAVLAERTQQIEAAGYDAQVSVLTGATNVFLHTEAGRFRLYADGDDLWLPETQGRFRREELLGRLQDRPAEFSPNVFLRPVVESTVFPTLAYVGGPGEISYFAQLTALFPEFGLTPPVVYPRAAFTLVEPPIARLLEKLELSREDLARPRHELVDDLARRSMPESVQAALDRLVDSVTSGYRELIEVAAGLDPTLEEALASLRNQALARIGDSEKKVVRHLKRKEEVAVGQLDRARAHLRPEGEPQDRVLNVLPFLARHGPELLQAVAERIEPEIR